ncbi:MAG TPA: hypothetical protein VNC84_07450 [Gammaproteobacteria bacterium]|jgi:hypothetical protein|nr:hypothetical protein [Gammaproteobacteria bacterium]
MWLLKVTNFILLHRKKALAMTFGITFLPVLGALGILIAAFVTLIKGPKEGALFSLAAIAPYLISFAFSGGGEASTPLVLWAALGVAVVSNLLTWVFAVMLYKRASWSMVVQTAALLGVLFVSVVHLINPKVESWWNTELQRYYEAAKEIETVTDKTAAVDNQIAQSEAIKISSHYATGFMSAAVLINALLQLAVARWWQSVAFKPGSFRQEMHNIRLSRLAGLLFGVSLTLAYWDNLSYWDNSVVLDMMPILYALFTVAGLSLIHFLFGLKKLSVSWFFLSIVYITLAFLLPGSVIFVSMIALIDIPIDVRARLQKR